MWRSYSSRLSRQCHPVACRVEKQQPLRRKAQLQAVAFLDAGIGAHPHHYRRALGNGDGCCRLPSSGHVVRPFFPPDATRYFSDADCGGLAYRQVWYGLRFFLNGWFDGARRLAALAVKTISWDSRGLKVNHRRDAAFSVRDLVSSPSAFIQWLVVISATKIIQSNLFPITIPGAAKIELVRLALSAVA